MHYSTLLVASATLIQGALSAKISTFAGPNCTGAQKDIHVYDDTSVLNIPQFQSYRENGYGSHGQRVAFYTESGLPGTCGGAKIYDTWAYDGDYFHSHQCYNLIDHEPHKYGVASCVTSYYKL
ncbi:hypothetical protein FDECE_5075 [Fusarium decemcellulare]|nr:hypothetical protein FDECE_5075 [Fusarium decemcellulare]